MFSVLYPNGTYLIKSIAGREPCSEIVFAHLKKRKGSKSGLPRKIFLVSHAFVFGAVIFVY